MKIWVAIIDEKSLLLVHFDAHHSYSTRYIYTSTHIHTSTGIVPWFCCWRSLSWICSFDNSLYRKRFLKAGEETAAAPAALREGIPNDPGPATAADLASFNRAKSVASNLEGQGEREAWQDEMKGNDRRRGWQKIDMKKIQDEEKRRFKKRRETREMEGRREWKEKDD